MPADLEQQLPRFAEALDREAPAISVDEIVSCGTVAVDVDSLERSSWGRVARLGDVAWGGAMPGRRENGHRDASVELAPSAAEPPTRRHLALKMALAAAAAAVLVVALAAIVRIDDQPDPADVPPSTIPIAPPSTVPTAPPSTVFTPTTTVPVDPFVGAWLSTDVDGSSQTMQIVGVGGDGYELVLSDDFTTACSGAPATITGAGRLESDERLIVAQAELTCDDGTIPVIGLAPQAELANLAFDLDIDADQLIDSFGVVWRRADSTQEPAAPSQGTATSDGMWPQATLEEVRVAQQLADAGDSDYTWQVEPELVSMEYEETGQVQLVERFFREVLGWESYLFRPTPAGRARNGEYVDLVDQRYLRCAPGRTNPMYPPGPEPETDDEIYALLRRGDLCAPTIDDLTYETVSLDLTQPAGRGRDGIWVVKQWELTAPFAQADPAVVEAQGRQGLEEFIVARLAGDGADGHVEVDDDTGIPLLYATTSGVPYERYEIETVGRPSWPDASTTFSVRLFTEADTTVVEQQFRWVPSYGLRLEMNHPTTENGQPIVRSLTSSDGEVTLAAPDSWTGHLAGKTWGEQDQDIWIGSLSRRQDLYDPHERIEIVDPVAYDAWCAEYGGSPLLTAPANAAAIAQQVIDDPNFETTAPVAARIGGVEAVSIDVTLAAGGKACGIGMIDIPRWIHTIGWDPGWRLRLYLVDLPEGMSVETLAITVVAPEDRFDDVITETAPIIDSIEFHPR
jgi:hypothetical protein